MQRCLLVIFILSQFIVFSQSTGDYRSKQTGSWKDVNSWEYYNGSGWVTPGTSSPQGYPGQYAVTAGAVLIQSGHIITIQPPPSGSIAISTEPMGTVTIIGRLHFNGVNNTVLNYVLNTNEILVTNPGVVQFINKGALKLPINAVFIVTKAANPVYSGIDMSDCSNNQSIFIGLLEFSNCNGNGTTTGIGFEGFVTGGGTLNANTSSNSPVCEGGTISLVGSTTGITGKKTIGGVDGVNYNWLITAPNGSQTTSSAQSPTISNAQAGTYTAKLTVSTVYNNAISYENYEIISVIVNPKPIISSASTAIICSGNAQNYSITSVVPSTYSWSRAAVSGISNAAVSATSNSITETLTNTTTAPIDVNYKITPTSLKGCVGPEFTYKVTVNPVIVNNTFNSSPQTICSGDSPIGFVGSTPAGGNTSSYSYSWQRSTTSASGPWIVVAASRDFSPGLLSETTWFRRTVVSGTCEDNSTTVQITVIPLPAIPQIGTITSPSCAVPISRVNLSGLPTGNWSISTNPATVTITGSGTTATISGLATNTNYTFTVTNTATSCTSLPSVNVNIPSPNPAIITNTWTSEGWSSGVPTLDQIIVFNENYDSDVDVYGCSCTVKSGVNVTIPSGKTLAITNYVKVLGTGTLTFENNASLVQTNDYLDTSFLNEGNIIYKRHTNKVKKLDYTYWSSPVKNQNFKLLTPNTPNGNFWSYENEATSYWKLHRNGAVNMVPGKGYIALAPQSFSATVASVDTNPKFIGETNNGIVEMPNLLGNKFHLLGNPYPSALDADKFLSDNTSVLEGTIYFWTHNSAPSDKVAGDWRYNYTSDDYAAYNQTGGVATAKAEIVGNDPNNGQANNNLSAPSGKIASGQAFFTRTTATGGKVTYNNSMRVGGGGVVGNNSQFFKFNANSKESKITEKSRLWLNLTNAQGAFKQTLMGYLTGATNDYDSAFDAESFDGNKYVDFYSVNQDKNLVIQGRSIESIITDFIPLGYRSEISGEFTISIDQVDGLFMTKDVFIEDKITDSIVNLNEGAYDFITEKGVFNNRFVLSYKNKINIKDEVEDLEKSIIVSRDDRQIKITSSVEMIDKLYVYDVTGRRLYYQGNIDSESTIISNLFSENQILLIKAFLKRGSVVSKKIVY